MPVPLDCISLKATTATDYTCVSTHPAAYTSAYKLQSYAGSRKVREEIEKWRRVLWTKIKVGEGAMDKNQPVSDESTLRILE